MSTVCHALLASSPSKSLRLLSRTKLSLYFIVYRLQFRGERKINRRLLQFLRMFTLFFCLHIRPSLPSVVAGRFLVRNDEDQMTSERFLILPYMALDTGLRIDLGATFTQLISYLFNSFDKSNRFRFKCLTALGYAGRPIRANAVPASHSFIHSASIILLPLITTNW